MRLAVNLGYFGMGMDEDNLAVAQAADRLGYAVAWVAEAYGSDVPSVLGWLAGQTEQIGLGAAIMQIPARTPAMTAMTAATIDHLSGGRMHLGLGVSGPQVSEGWHGVKFTAPLARTREYVDIVKMALSRQRVAYAGSHFTLPLPDGPGKSLKLTLPARADLPVYLAAVGPKTSSWPARSPMACWPSSSRPRIRDPSSIRCASDVNERVAGIRVTRWPASTWWRLCPSW